MMMRFEHDTYVTFDMPTARWTEQVLELRKKYDPDRAELPVEITIIGSSGVGVFENDQNPSQVFALLEKVAFELAPITCSLQRIETFPDTNLFYLAPSQAEKFDYVQKRIVATGLRFKETPFSFTPHCTVANLRTEDLEIGEQEIRKLPIPIEHITLDEMRVYSLNKFDCQLLFRTNLRGRA